MRLVFMGTPDFAVPTLDALAAAGHDIAAVYTQPPRPAGRGKQPQASSVQRRAETLGIAVRCPLTLRDDSAKQAFAALGADAAVVAAYGLILPQAVLAAPRHGCLNVHASLLPRWRGAAPIQRAILAGDDETGVTIMRMEAGLDTGPMLLAARTPIADKTAGALTDELATLGAALMVEALDRLPDLVATPQPDEGVTLAPKIGKAEARLDFARPAVEVGRQVRAFNPWPGAFTELNGERLKILSATAEDGSGPPGTTLDDGLLIACGAGAIRARHVQRAGRGAVDAGELLRGWPVPKGARLG